jgi:hypothetical protein
MYKVFLLLNMAFPFLWRCPRRRRASIDCAGHLGDVAAVSVFASYGVVDGGQSERSGILMPIISIIDNHSS